MALQSKKSSVEALGDRDVLAVARLDYGMHASLITLCRVSFQYQ
jgi:hypothetical protein